MLGAVPFAGITSTGQSTAQAVTTSAAQLVINGGTAMPTTATRAGNPAVRPDVSNNRLIFNAPGIFRVALNCVGVAASALQTTFQLRKNGSSGTTISGVSKETWATTPSTHSAFFVVEITAADLPAAGGQSAFSDPDSTAGAGKPAGGFAGAGAAPKSGVPVDVLVTGNGSVNLTLSDVRFEAEQIG